MSDVESVHTDPIRILFVGGCHTSGCSLGEDHGFPMRIGEELAKVGVRVDVRILPHTKLSHRHRILAKCQKERPQILVMQLGHPELTSGIEDYLRQLCGLPKTRKAQTPDFPVDRPFLFHLKSCFKALLNHVLCHPLTDLARVEQLWRVLLSDVERLRIPEVLVLSPLPCADRATMYYRRRGLSLFRDLATEYRCRFLDVLTDAPQGRVRNFGPNQYHFDGMHLADGGQTAIGRAVANDLRVVVTSLERCLS